MENQKKNSMKLTSLEELEDMTLGPVGTPRRDEYEHKLALEMQGIGKVAL